MDMPTPCPGCGEAVEFNEMLAHPNEFVTMVCDRCHDRITEENNQGLEKDNYGNTLSWKATPDYGLIEISLNGEELVSWCYEDEPESVFNEFFTVWKKAQEAAREQQ